MVPLLDKFNVFASHGRHAIRPPTPLDPRFRRIDRKDLCAIRPVCRLFKPFMLLHRRAVEVYAWSRGAVVRTL